MLRTLWGWGLLGWFLVVAPPANWGETRAEDADAKLTLQTRSYPEPGKILVSVRVAAIPDTPDTAGLTLDVQLRRPGQQEALSRTTVDTQPEMREEIALDAAALAAGSYAVAVELRRSPGEKIAEVSAEVQWPGRAEAFKDIKILNNFVWELLELHKAPDRAVEGDHEVRVPYDRWLLVRSKSVEGKPGKIGVSLDGQALHGHAPGAAQTLESMRFVKAGKHTVRVAAEGDAAMELLQVRAVPEVQHSRYPASTMYVKQGVEYDWEFIQRHILPHVNTIISAGFPESAEPHLRAWKERGGKWISYTNRASFAGKKDAEADVEACAKYYAERPGYAQPLLDGVLVDEFYEATDPYETYAAAIRRLNAQFPGKSFYPYAAGVFGKDPGSAAFSQACIEGGGYVCWEAYIGEWDNLKSALNAMRWYPGARIIPFEDRLPGVVRHMIWVPGVFSFPWPYADGYASVNYNAYLDMQFQFIATHPALFGLGGVHIWRTGYCDEERLRWCGRFFRHYCLEGNTARVSDDPYMLTHIGNPDFADGPKVWTLQPAAAESITAGKRERFGKFIGRYYRGPDTFLVTQRGEKQPNVFSQEIRDLKPGRLYSVKMFTGDHGDLVAGKSRKEVHAVSLVIEGGELIKDDRHSYQAPFPTRGDLDPFTEAKPFWLNYHWQVFRATSPTATLRISDWKTPEEPRGPVGQQILYTFVEVKPYLEDGP